MSMIVGLAVFLAAVIGFALFMKNFRKSGVKMDKKDLSPSPPPPKKTPEEEMTGILDTLLKLNLLIRRDPGLSEEILAKIETIIDDVKSVLPPLFELYPGETLTYELKKIGSNHLYKIAKEYLDLSAESRNIQEKTFEKTVADLHEVVHRARDIVEKNETAEFKTMANFLAGKFS